MMGMFIMIGLLMPHIKYYIIYNILFAIMIFQAEY